MKTLTLEQKLEIVERNARARGVSEAAITRQRLQDLEREMTQRREAIAKQFDLDCWNGFASEFSPEEIHQMSAHERHRKFHKYKAGGAQ